MMFKERLNRLTLEQLQEVAHRGNISFFEDMDRNKMIELILDAMEEDQEERNAQHNMAVKIEAIKFNAYLMEELNIDYDEDLTLPERYNETKMIFMPRDPSWGFLYWDIEEKVRESLEKREDFAKIYLRIYQLDSASEDTDDASDYFDIPIQFGDRRRYINLPENDTWYKAEIRVLAGERDSVMVRSNSIKTSREFVMPAGDDSCENSDLLVGLSGVSTDFGSFPGKDAEQKFPHRIFPFNIQEES